MDIAVKYPRHDAYQNTEISWLGEIPIHWNLKKNKFLLEEKKASVGKKSSDYTLLSLTLKGVIARDMENPQGKFPAEFNTYKIVNPNDLIFCLFDVEETPRTVGHAQLHGMITGAYTVMECQSSVSARYLSYYYLFLDNDKKLKPLYTGLRKVIQRDTFMSIKSPLPPRDEQDRIANFLDQKTAEIDEAIAKKQRLIELLKEQKAILINQAVTKGLNPDVPMRDSGVEWIGEVPVHWKIKKLKYLITCPLQYGANEEAKNCVEGNPRYIRITDFSDDGLLKQDTKRTLPEDKAKGYFLNKGDILFARSGATVGKTFLFDSDEISCFAGYLIRATADPSKIDPVYLYLYTKSSAFGYWRDVTFSKATIQNIGADKYSTLPVVIPPLTEQKAILQHIALLEKDINPSLISAQKHIDLLHEFKQTLIAESVTGKIKI